MNHFRHLLLALLLAGLVLPTTGCWQVLALQGAMAAAQIAGAETDSNPDVEYCDQQDQFIKDYFAKDKYDMPRRTRPLRASPSPRHRRWTPPWPPPPPSERRGLPRPTPRKEKAPPPWPANSAASPQHPDALHRPFHSGLRFSRNALGPSSASRLSRTMSHSSRFAAHSDSSSVRLALRASSRAARTASGALA